MFEGDHMPTCGALSICPQVALHVVGCLYMPAKGIGYGEDHGPSGQLFVSRKQAKMIRMHITKLCAAG